ncbi:hypothetical protein U4960_11480 [Altererythrobacter sp. H2]|uniref:hypothetical protein n=1 Tax=Altererythrobacter sp. H2 TaxID=3108391 RepID=UPI002B4BCEF8|nr:hypothetical protein [Altererythrobacter sp. H2]WRK94911.1 hypothetical protein U4960_11480 [Altererythrobacter sp. H2]
MSALNRRLSALEGARRESSLSPWAKQWLGIQLTGEEQERVDNESPPEFDGDLSGFSKEVREWLQQ